MADPERALCAFEEDRLLVYGEGTVRVPLAGGPEDLGLDVTFR